MLERALNLVATKITVTRNFHGDFKDSKQNATYRCRLRENVLYNKQNQMEGTNSDAMMWFAPNTPVAINDIFSVNGQYYKVIKVLNAIPLGSNRTAFIKAAVTNIKQVIS